MAKRFAGPNSPGAKAEGEGETRRRQAGRRPFGGPSPARRDAARARFLFLAPLPLAVLAFFREPYALVQSLAAFALLILAAWLTRAGIEAQAAYDARKIARRPAIPRKIFAAALTGAGLGLASLIGIGPPGAALLALLGAALHLLAFGPDPLRDKGMAGAMAGIDAYQGDRVARAVEKAEAHLGAMQAAIARTGERTLTRRGESFAATARAMFRAIEDDPRDLGGARKYLGVYLGGARAAAEKFAELYARAGDGGDRGDRGDEGLRQSARRDFLALLDDLEEGFAAKTQALLANDGAGLEVEIEVLRERLAREGVALERERD